MSTTVTERLNAFRRPATALAEKELGRLGFAKKAERTWIGKISNGQGAAATLRVELPRTFPDSVPRIAVEEGAAAEVYAHFEREKYLCIASPAGTLIDAERPKQLINDALERAKHIVLGQSVNEHNDDLLTEFMAYWPQPNGETIYSLCPVPANAKQVVVVDLTSEQNTRIIAPDFASAKQWAERVHGDISEATPALLLPLATAFLPPRFDEQITLKQFRTLIEQHASEPAKKEFAQWLARIGVPSLVLLSQPLPHGRGHAMFAAGLPKPSSADARLAQRGFRPGHVPKMLLVNRANSAPIARYVMERFDPSYLIERGGGNATLLDKRVLVVGCGSVGSHVAMSLVSSGVGTLRLVDLQVLANANVHRHVLGVNAVGKKKAEALAAHILERFPHLKCTFDARDILTILDNEPQLASEYDLFIIALGDETLERRLNAVFKSDVRRVHVWLEPLGLGGHVLSTGCNDHPGCYECLLRLHENHGLVNMAGLVEPGQSFQRTLGACAGTFTPYGAIDAQRASVETVRIAMRILLDKDRIPLLGTWCSTHEGFGEGGYKLSPRGQLIPPGNYQEKRDFNRPECPVCGGSKS